MRPPLRSEAEQAEFDRRRFEATRFNRSNKEQRINEEFNEVNHNIKKGGNTILHPLYKARADQGLPLVRPLRYIGAFLRGSIFQNQKTIDAQIERLESTRQNRLNHDFVVESKYNGGLRSQFAPTLAGGLKEARYTLDKSYGKIFRNLSSSIPNSIGKAGPREYRAIADYKFAVSESNKYDNKRKELLKEMGEATEGLRQKPLLIKAKQDEIQKTVKEIRDLKSLLDKESVLAFSSLNRFGNGGERYQVIKGKLEEKKILFNSLEHELSKLVSDDTGDNIKLKRAESNFAQIREREKDMEKVAQGIEEAMLKRSGKNLQNNNKNIDENNEIIAKNEKKIITLISATTQEKIDERKKLQQENSELEKKNSELEKQNKKIEDLTPLVQELKELRALTREDDKIISKKQDEISALSLEIAKLESKKDPALAAEIANKQNQKDGLNQEVNTLLANNESNYNAISKIRKEIIEREEKDLPPNYTPESTLEIVAERMELIERALLKIEEEHKALAEKISSKKHNVTRYEYLDYEQQKVLIKNLRQNIKEIGKIKDPAKALLTSRQAVCSAYEALNPNDKDDSLQGQPKRYNNPYESRNIEVTELRSRKNDYFHSRQEARLRETLGMPQLQTPISLTPKQTTGSIDISGKKELKVEVNNINVKIDVEKTSTRELLTEEAKSLKSQNKTPVDTQRTNNRSTPTSKAANTHVR